MKYQCCKMMTFLLNYVDYVNDFDLIFIKCIANYNNIWVEVKQYHTKL